MTQEGLKELKEKMFDTGKTKDDDSVLENGNKADKKKYLTPEQKDELRLKGYYI